ncbi:MAG: hypothetical protein HeimC3_27570 [Candidatus Heimdallarchaeota archaeon LC_3]|nr:MAG: hypothetical protein HeimC3_27570 [Candidatus Heimdallarchaeota archaeon LC_3]
MRTKDIITILTEKNIEKWKNWLNSRKVNDQISVNDLGEAIVPYIQIDNEYFQFAELIWNHFNTDEDKQSLLWIWIEDVYRLNEDYASFILKLLTGMDKKVDYDSLAYFFDLLTLYYLPKAREDHIDFLKTNFFEMFLFHSDVNIRSQSSLFAFREQLNDKIPNSILENFSKLFEKLQEQLLDPIFTIPYTLEFIKWIERQINDSLTQFSIRIKTGLIIHILKNSVYHKNQIQNIKEIIDQAEEIFILETVLLYLLPAEIISQPLLQPIIDVYINKEKEENILLLLRHLPQFFDDWPQKLKELVVVKLKDHPNGDIRAAILRQLIAPTWINEELLIAGFNDKDEQVQNAACLSAAIVFQKMSSELKKQTLKFLHSANFKQNGSYGFFVGFNNNYGEFKDESKTILLQDYQNNETSVIFCLRGLILNWNRLSSDLQKLITNKIINYWPENIQKSVHESFNMYSGVLDSQGRQIIDYLSKENSFLSIDLDVIND